MRLLVLSIQFISAYLLTQLEQLKTVELVSAYRKTIGLDAISFNESLGISLRSYLASKSNGFIFNNGTRNASTWYGYTMMNDPYFANYKGNKFVIHDTFAGKPFNIFSIHNFRLTQIAKCFDLRKCSSSYDYFKTCIPLLSSPMCTNVNQYIPLISRSLQSYAIVSIDYKGPYSPKGQNYSFWAYGYTDYQMYPPALNLDTFPSDKPY